MLGFAVGVLGDALGLCVGLRLGLFEGLADGDALGSVEGLGDGDILGLCVGLRLGLVEGIVDGAVVGDPVGVGVGRGESQRRVLVLQIPLAQSRSSLHVLFSPHGGQSGPPQSTAVSLGLGSLS